MGKYPAYPEYKLTGDVWLGGVPNHWQVIPNKYLCQMTKGKNPISTEPSQSEGWLPYLSMAYLRGQEAPSYASPESTQLVADEGDILLLWDGSNAGEYIRAKKGLVSSTMALISVPHKLMHREFYYYLCKSFEYELKLHTIGMGIPHVNGGEVKTRVFPKPTADEQALIAAFLDHETTRIDHLIVKQERLIELLKEKRQAVISHTVTKGLSPDAPMRGSDVEWLAEVPAHWVVGALKHGWEVIDCKHLTAPFVDDGIPLASIREVQKREVDLSEAKKTTPEFYLQLIEGGRKPRLGDIIYSRNATVGEAALVVDRTEFAMGQDVSLLRPKNQNSEYFLYQLESKSIKSQLDMLMVGATFKRINVADIKNLKVTFPQVDEQTQIVKYLREIELKFERLTGYASHAVELLREHRTAIISAAVTGKIDVRNWQKPVIEPEKTATAVSA